MVAATSCCFWRIVAECPIFVESKYVDNETIKVSNKNLIVCIRCSNTIRAIVSTEKQMTSPDSKGLDVLEGTTRTI